MFSVTLPQASEAMREKGNSYRCLKGLGRTAHGNRSARANTFWQHDEIVLVNDDKEDVYFLPTRCPTCDIEIVFDLRDHPYCKVCGAIFPNPDKRHSDNWLSGAIRKAKEQDRKARDRRLPAEFREQELCERPHLDLSPLQLGKIQGRHKHYSECQAVTDDRQDAIDRLVWGLKPI